MDTFAPLKIENPFFTSYKKHSILGEEYLDETNSRMLSNNSQNYQIMVPVTQETLMWAKVGGKCYHDAHLSYKENKPQNG